MISDSRMAYASDSHGTDAFILLGLVSGSTASWDETVGCRLQVLHSFRTDIERFVFLSDLRTSNPALFDAVLQDDNALSVTFSEMSDFIGMMVDI